jgi:hypothetical protein
MTSQSAGPRRLLRAVRESGDPAMGQPKQQCLLGDTPLPRTSLASASEVGRLVLPPFVLRNAQGRHPKSRTVRGRLKQGGCNPATVSSRSYSGVFDRRPRCAARAPGRGCVSGPNWRLQAPQSRLPWHLCHLAWCGWLVPAHRNLLLDEPYRSRAASRPTRWFTSASVFGMFGHRIRTYLLQTCPRLRWCETQWPQRASLFE